jgi:hypothetical protein
MSSFTPGLPGRCARNRARAGATKGAACRDKAATRSGDGAREGGELVHDSQRVARPAVKRAAFCRGRQPALGAVDQRRAERRFQRRQNAADRRRRQRHPIGCGFQRPAFDHGAKRPQSLGAYFHFCDPAFRNFACRKREHAFPFSSMSPGDPAMRPIRMLAFAALVLSGLAAPARADSNVVTCALTLAGERYQGRCAIPCMVNDLAIEIDGPNPRVSCDRPPRRVAATLRQVAGENWLGTMEGKFPEDPTRFELTKAAPGAAGVAKLPYGWFALSEARIEGATLHLSIDAARQLPPNQDDIRIIRRALELVATERVWNRAETRICAPNPAQWSVFCALTQATTEVSGGVHYRQPALQAVREVLKEVGLNRVDRHRLMDYNNHPDTTLADIHNLLKLSERMLERRFR